ncbi:MAG: bacillithiol system redox-active protein YtxJ [bacterium]
MITDIHDETELAKFLQHNATAPVFLLKHSTRCPISAAAHRQFSTFAELGVAPCARVLVIEDRACSNAITENTGVPHCSPQVLLFSNGKVVWHTSHHDVTVQRMQNALIDFSTKKEQA